MTHQNQVLERIDVVIHPRVRLSLWTTPGACGPAGCPDPSIGPRVELAFGPNGLGIHPNIPAFQAAHAACHGNMPGSK
jgi:hypothetical protein